jgi:hypothetical protein
VQAYLDVLYLLQRAEQYDRVPNLAGDCFVYALIMAAPGNGGAIGISQLDSQPDSRFCLVYEHPPESGILR